MGEVTTQASQKKTGPLSELKVVIQQPLVLAPDFINIPDTTAQMIADKLLDASYVDVTNGFPARDADQLSEILIILLKNSVNRIPFIGREDQDNPGSIKVFMLTNKKYKPPMHNNLMDEMGLSTEGVLSFAIEGVDNEIRQESFAALKLTNSKKAETYLPINLGSATTDIKAGFTPQGLVAFKKVFTIEGVDPKLI